MNDYFIQLTATRAYAGVLLLRVLRSVIVWGAIVAFGLPLISLATQGDMIPLVVYGSLIAFGRHILESFLKDRAFNDSLPVGPTRNLALHLSADMVKSLSKERSLKPFALLRAAVHTPRGKFMLNEIGISASDFLARFASEIEKIIDVYGFLVKAKSIAETKEQQTIDANIILYFFFQHGGPFTELLNEKDLSLNDLERIVEWEAVHFDWYTAQHSWRPERLMKRFGTIGRSWVMGYTSELDRLTTDISSTILDVHDTTTIIHQEFLETAQHVLNRSSNQNLLLLGKPGVGKTHFVYNIAHKLRSHEVQKSLPLTRVLLLKTEQLLAGTQRPDMALLEALKRATGPGRFLFVIEDIALLLRSADANLQAVLMKLIQSNDVAIMAIGSVQDYHSLIKKNTGIDAAFEKLFLPDASETETMEVLMTHYFNLEEKRHLHMTYKALKSIIQLSQRYIGKGGFPGKAIAVLGDALSAAMRRGDTNVTETDVREMISMKAHIDVRQVNEGEKTRLLHLEESLNRNVIGQPKAIASLVNSLKRAKLHIQSSKRPLGTFLLLGPTGVGKTETAKALAREYFGSEEALIRLDMNEYATEGSVNQIIGAPEAGDELSEGHLARQVQDRPFSLILLDEIEKAHPKVLNLFLQVLDEGVMRDSIGATTDFRNTIIIATSNAGAKFIRDFVKEHQTATKESFQQDLVESIIDQDTFSPEFINRFDEVILYYPLGTNDALKLAIIMIDSVIKDLLDTRGIYLKMDEEVVSFIAKKGYSTEFGAREMRRTVTDILENYIANYLLEHNVKRGEEMYIKKEDL